MALKPRHRRLAADLASAVLIALSGYLVWLGSSERESVAVLAAEPSASINNTPAAPDGVHPVDAEDKVWGRQLRRPLYDPPPPPVVKKELPPIRAKLLGTILEPRAATAMIGQPDGSILMLGVGDTLGPQDSDATIQQIDVSSIEVARGEDVSTLKIEAAR